MVAKYAKREFRNVDDARLIKNAPPAQKNKQRREISCNQFIWS